jgi:hypothetical protein
MIGAQLLRESRARTCGMVGSVNTGRNTREEERERRGSPSPTTSFPGGGGGRDRAAALGVYDARVRGCDVSAKGSAGARARLK